MTHPFPSRSEDPAIAAIARALTHHAPRVIGDEAPDPPLWRASVALVVRPQAGDPEVLLIRRATVEGDPWSGHMALPGGRRDPRDPSGRHTAVRETHEEVGIDLDAEGRFLGRLDDVTPRSGGPLVAVSPYVFAVPAGSVARPNHEVDLALWVPVERLAHPGAATEYLHALASGTELRFPAIGYGDHVIWGLTHRILGQFLELTRRSEEAAGGA